MRALHPHRWASFHGSVKWIACACLLARGEAFRPTRYSPARFGLGLLRAVDGVDADMSRPPWSPLCVCLLLFVRRNVLPVCFIGIVLLLEMPRWYD